jgi:hypothetical protein
MTNSQYYSAEQEQKDIPLSVNTDDAIRPDWFEKIIKQLESNKNTPRKPNYQKV